MLELRLNKDKVINDDGDIILTDMTGNVGDIYYVPSEIDATQYDAVTNVGGYGAPNEERGTLSLSIVGTKMEEEYDGAVEFDVYDPLTVTSWTARIGLDGVYKFKIVAGTYESPEEDFLYLVNAGKLYTSLVLKRVEMQVRNCTEREVTLCTRAIDDIRSGIYAAEYEYCRGNYINCVRIITYLTKKDYTAILNI